MPVEVGTDGWTEVVPASHGYDHVYLSVDGGDVYATNEEEPNQPLPYGRLLRDGDTFDLERCKQNLLSKGEPIYCQAVDNSAEVRVVSDSQAVAQSRRAVERPSDTASREDRRGVMANSGDIPGSGTGAVTVQANVNSEAGEFPVYVESVSAWFNGLDYDDEPMRVSITEPGRGRVRRTASLYKDVSFNPGIRVTSDGAITVEVFNRSGGTETLQVRVNYRATKSVS